MTMTRKNLPRRSSFGLSVVLAVRKHFGWAAVLLIIELGSSTALEPLVKTRRYGLTAGDSAEKKKLGTRNFSPRFDGNVITTLLITLAMYLGVRSDEQPRQVVKERAIRD
jgi:hypothetical protein